MSEAVKALPRQTVEALRAGVSLQAVQLVPSCLVEVVSNSIDAGSDRIVVQLLPASESGFVVTDNGPGIAQLSLIGCRYASSKKAASVSLGYRGEALVSISQLGRLRVVTRAAGSFETFERVLEQGQLVRHGACAPHRAQTSMGSPHGTCVEVSQLRAPVAAPGSRSGCTRCGVRAAVPTAGWVCCSLRELYCAGAPQPQTCSACCARQHWA
ncbi:histidine kinase-like ATPase [Haematococcus lacustris]